MSYTRQTIRDLIPPAEPRKVARVLAYLATHSGLNSIDAEKLLDEHSLPSTISTLTNEYGLKIIRADDPELDRYRSYSLDTSPETLERAYKLLTRWGYRDPQGDLFNNGGG